MWRDLLSENGAISSPGGVSYILGPQPISDPPVGLGFARRAGRYRPGGSFLSFPDFGVVELGEISQPGMGIYRPRVRRDWGVPSRGNSRRARRGPSLAEGGRRRALDQWPSGSENQVCIYYCTTPPCS